jgi:hypothetical protein
VGIKLRSAAWVMAGVLPVAAGLVASAFVPAHAAVTCPGRVASDFNGDLIADLLVGDPLAGPAFNDVQTGSVTVFYGSDVAGIPEGTNSLITPGMAGMPVNLSGGDFGRVVTPGYFNDDCFADAVISAPRSNAVVVLYGSNSGLTTQGSATFNADAFVEEPGADDFGSALTAGDFNGDGWDDLAVGAWRGDQFHDAVLRGGAVGIFPGSATGLTMTGSQWITQQTAGVPGANEYWDGFGTSVAAGDLTGDGRAELVVGVPGEDIGSTADAAASSFSAAPPAA